MLSFSGSGIGRQTTRQLARQGCRLVLWDISEAGMKETNEIIVKEGSNPATTYVVDVTNPEDVHKTADKVHL